MNIRKHGIVEHSWWNNYGACHAEHSSITNAAEINLIRTAEEEGCQVCPHHLFLTKDSVSVPYHEVRLKLATGDNRVAFWKRLDYIDCFATDHAPHTIDEKIKGMLGFPSEYMLPLLLTAVSEGKMTLKQLTDRLYFNLLRIFGLPV